MNLELTGKVALVTGSTAGIGQAIVARLAAEGARVILNGRTPRGVEEAIARVRAETGSAEVYGFAGDLSSEASCQEVAARHPEVTILVNNLGVFEPKPFDEISDADWRLFFEVNVLSGVRLARLERCNPIGAGSSSYRAKARCRSPRR